MKTRMRTAGEFCWINVLTPEPEAARAFFGSLLGWTYVELPGMGHRVQVGGHDVGGLFDLAAPQTPPGTAPGIGVMIKVDDADATCARVRELGGRAGEPFDIGPQGRMAECRDPNGAQFDLWEPKASAGMQVEGDIEGVPSWFETLTSDTSAAERFYTALFGWKAETTDMPTGAYTVFSNERHPLAGMMALTPEMNMPPLWAVYFTVNDIEAATARARSLGAQIYIPVTEVPDTGRFSCMASPQGVWFYLMQYAPRAVPSGG